MIVLWLIYCVSVDGEAGGASDFGPMMPFWLLKELQAAPVWFKMWLLDRMAATNLYFPGAELVTLDGMFYEFAGAVNVFFRRWIGRPFDYPDDPVLGFRKPQPVGP